MPIQHNTGTPRPDQGRDRPFTGHLGLHIPEWMTDANCASTDPEVFFPTRGGSTREAKNICGHCTVQAECLDYILAEQPHGDSTWRLYGVYGGLAPRQRRPILDALGRTTHHDDTDQEPVDDQHQESA